jgi:4-amino-4-deoxy-L-arabinose transferase-like glycosyltransferase
MTTTTADPNAAVPDEADASGPAGFRPVRRGPRRFSSRLLHGHAGEGPADDPRWVWPAVLGLLAATALLYLWGLGASGWANSFYSAAVQAGTKSWRAFFFGSFDSSNFISVDKPPAALWVMELSARLFGVNAWSILVPQALAGVASVGLLYATVRRRFGPAAGLLSGAVLALTPVATLMFRFNNPDALLVLLLIGSAYAMVRALEDGRTRWLVLAGALIGFGFLAKMLQTLLVVPGFALVYLYAAPTTLRRRLGQLLAGGAAMVIAAGWWIAAVALTPASARPYVGGSQHNSILELTFGYNGFGRLTGDETGSVGGGPAGAGTGRWGATGITRMFNGEMGGQIAWLLPAALLLLATTLWFARRAPRTDAGRAQVLLWGGWLLVTGLVFSFAKGIIHPYYTVALAPAVGALVGIGAETLWRRRQQLLARGLLAAAVLTTVVWAYVLLERSSSWLPGLRTLILVGGVVAAVLLVGAPRLPGQASAAVAGALVVVSLAGPAAYAVNTAATPHAGALPSAGPAIAGGGFGGFGRLAGGNGGPGGGGGLGGGQLPSWARRGLPGQGVPGLPNGGLRNGGRTAGGLGGLLDAATPNSQLVSLLRDNAGSYRWVAATTGANSAAGVQLATDRPVLAIGGFNGTDPTPSLAAFQQLVAAGKIHYYLGGGTSGPGGRGSFGGGGSSSSSTSSEISTWVTENFTAQTVGGVTVYDLTAADGSAAGSTASA